MAEFSFRTRRVSGNNWDRGFKSNVMVDDDDPSIPRANMDMNLLLASLEKEAEVVEDEAEAVSIVCCGLGIHGCIILGQFSDYDVLIPPLLL